ncbi:RpiR family transcriptional regulator [Oceanobacillus oncorhynchi subsp. incaldanensis]|uniref:MurR/RpiR family transcriptional regulator n=1 Tax=Oceanobacillus oncorhynchi TaxID=545501 RepID=UPI001B0BEE81|nr:MurR/RpiR family transcriptional regulator [Oceanobacillus oncorhynchi]GIO20392.1 RpiR family transcriptional regulator [Oceanobacillus oncorhynchi subsp. incaldanensis]
MEDIQPIKELIEAHFNALSKKQQKVANFVLNNPTFVGTHSAAEVGKKAETSETTVIRFCYALGLEGYAELQKKITLFVFNQNTVSTLGNYFSAKKKLFNDQHLIEKVMQKDITQIDRIAEQIDKELFYKATQQLHEAKNIYIIGAGASQFPAHWLHFTLNILRPNVSIIHTETPELIRTMQEIDEDDVVITISLHRYFKEPIHIAETLHKRGITVLAITDSKLAPIQKHCSYAFVLEQTEKSTIDLMPSLISFLNLVVTGMMTFDPDYYEKQRVNYDDFNHTFISDKWS